MLLRRLALVCVISSLFSVGLSRGRHHGGMKRNQIPEDGVTDVPVIAMPSESTTTTPQSRPQLTKRPDLHSNGTHVNGTTTKDEIHSGNTHVLGPKVTQKLNVTKAEVGGLTLMTRVNGTKAEEVTINKTKNNVEKDSTKDAPDNHLKKVTLNLKNDNVSAILFNKSDSVSSANRTEGGVGLAVPEKQDLDKEDDLSNTDEGGLTEILNPASKGVADIVNTFLTFWNPGQSWMSLKQILFFHIFVISIYYLLVCIMQGFIVLINQLRTPLLIYKEVKDVKEEKPVPMPKLPPPHKEYGYEGGFKTPKGEQIKYVTYNETHVEKPPEGAPKAEAKPGAPPMADAKPGGPPMGDAKPGGPPKAEAKPGGPPAAGHPEPPKMAFHEPPPLTYQQGPVVHMGGGGPGPQQMSSYTSYAGQAMPHPS